MTSLQRGLATVCFVAVAAVTAAIVSVYAQQPLKTEPLPPTYAQMRHNSGQSVQPVFEGWNKNPDGTFNLVFGYYNRNFNQTPAVPVGADNNFSPGDPDRGQPTFFYSRLNRFVFRVIVPANFGDQQLTWTVAANGQPAKAIGSLGREWEIEPRWDFGGGASAKNNPPTLTVPDRLTATAGVPLTVAATVSDDGLPPAPSRGRITNQGVDAFPTLHKGVKGPTNVPMLPAQPKVRGGNLSVGWILWRGPAAASIAPFDYQVLKSRTGGEASATVTFAQPGAYVLRAEASDGTLHDIELITVTVSSAGGSAQSR